MACPVNGHYASNSDYNKFVTEMAAKSFQKNDDTDLKTVDPRAMIALARMNWLHSRYKIVCPLFYVVQLDFILLEAK
jgi:hypothetical protein